MRERVGSDELAGNVWHLKRYIDGDAENFEEFSLTLHFLGASLETAALPDGVRVAGHLAPCTDQGSLQDAEVRAPKLEEERSDNALIRGLSGMELDGVLTKVALRLEHRDPQGGTLCVYRSERFVADGDGQFRGVWMCGARTGRFSAARKKSPEEPRKRKSACRRKADAEIKSKRFFNDLKDELFILDRLGWTEKRWKEESKLEKGRAILRELRCDLDNILGKIGLAFHDHTPWLHRVELGIAAARRTGAADLLRQLRAVDCSGSAPADDNRSDWHTLFEIQRHFCALPPFRATKFLEPSNVRHALRCAEVLNWEAFQRGRYIGGARRLMASRLPQGFDKDDAGKDSDGQREELQRKVMIELEKECIAGEFGVDEAYDVHIHLIIRARCSEFIWEPGPDIQLRLEDRVYYEQAHVWSEERRTRRHRDGQDPEEMQRRLVEFERLLTGGREDQVYEDDFEFVEMTARGESGAAEGVPAFLDHCVTGDVNDACRLFERLHLERGWSQRPRALNLAHLFKTRLAGYRHHKSREIDWGPGPELHWERGDKPLRLLRMTQEPVRVRFCRHEEPYGFHLQDLRGGCGGCEVVEVVDGSPAEVRGVVVGRTVKRLYVNGVGQDVRHMSRPQIEEALERLPNRFTIEFGKGDTEERRHAPLGDAEMAILMDERFMRGFLHELWHGYEDAVGDEVWKCFDHEGWGHTFRGLEPKPVNTSRGSSMLVSTGGSGVRTATVAIGESARQAAKEVPLIAPPPSPPPPLTRHVPTACVGGKMSRGKEVGCSPIAAIAMSPPPSPPGLTNGIGANSRRADLYSTDMRHPPQVWISEDALNSGRSNSPIRVPLPTAFGIGGNVSQELGVGAGVIWRASNDIASSSTQPLGTVERSSVKLGMPWKVQIGRHGSTPFVQAAPAASQRQSSNALIGVSGTGPAETVGVISSATAKARTIGQPPLEVAMFRAAELDTQGAAPKQQPRSSWAPSTVVPSFYQACPVPESGISKSGSLQVGQMMKEKTSQRRTRRGRLAQRLSPEC